MIATAVLCFGAGAASLLSPCTFPILPGVVAALGGAKRSEASRWSLVGRVLLFAFGAAVALCGSMALLLVAGVYIDFLAPPASLILGAIFFIVALTSLGVIHVPGHNFIVSERLGVLRPLVLGVMLGVVWIPCIGPMLGVVLGLSSHANSLPMGLAMGFLYFLGLSIPLIVFGVLFVRVSRGRRWAARVGRAAHLIAAVSLAIVGVLLATGLWADFSVWLVGISSPML